ncbi:hypothetical protein CLIB1444_01S00122 [[Candida] jaroonii]|uniref:Uncharacterized protein n=1 Tax=[Candida] jaroonii TaxID=467808 RepID=A0ACA9XZU5_9ASCO|nr:hypothetical protein CLIB1444_01S00122 [[Candida] jaroonii]
MSSSPSILKRFRNSIKHKSSSTSNSNPEFEDNQVLNLLESIYIEGQKHAEQEFGKKVKVYGWSDPKQSQYYQDLIHQAYQEGQMSYQKQHSTNKDNVILSTAKGNLLSTPPKINRQPVDKLAPGDFANDKKPIDDSLVDEKNLYENNVGSYGNEAATKEGTGYYFDPKDTQGGYYGTGPGASEDPAFEEATRAKLERQRNLKTVPTAYQNVDESEDVADTKNSSNAAKDENDKAQQKDARNDDDYDNDANDNEKEELDPAEQHRLNKSIYNKEGVSSALNEGSGSDLGKNAAAGAAGVAAGAGGYAAYKSKDSEDSKKQTNSETNKPLNHKTSSNSYDDIQPNLSYDEKTPKQRDVNLAEGSAGIPPSSDKFDYDTEMKRVNNNINDTKSRIDSLQAEDNASTKALKSPNSEYAPKSDSDGHSTATNVGLMGGVAAGTAAAIGAAKKLAGLDKVDATKSDIPEVKGAYEQGVKSGAYDAGKEAYNNEQSKPSSKDEGYFGSTTNSVPSSKNTTDSTQSKSMTGAATGALATGTAALGLSGSNKKDSDVSKNSSNNSKTLDPKATTQEEDIKTESYEAGRSSGVQGMTNVSKDTSKDVTTESTPTQHSESSPGLFTGAAGVLGAAGAVAVGALGFGGKPDTASTVNDQMVVNESYEAGKNKATKENVVGSKSTESSTPKNIAGSHRDSPTAPNLKEIDSDYEEVNASGEENNAATAAAISSASATGAAVGSGVASSKKEKPANDYSKNVTGTTHDPKSLVNNVANYPDVSDKPQHKTSKKVEDFDTNNQDTTVPQVQKVPGLESDSETGEANVTRDDEKLSKETDSEHSSSSPKKGLFAGAIGAAAGALGYSAYSNSKQDSSPTTSTGGKTVNHERNLVEEAAYNHEDVAKAPKHGNSSSGVTHDEIKDELDNDDSELKASKASASLERQRAKEEAIGKYNKDHGFLASSAKPLIEVADVDSNSKSETLNSEEKKKATQSDLTDGPAQEKSKDNSNLIKGSAIGGGSVAAATAAVAGLSKKPFSKEANFSDDDLHLGKDMKPYYNAGYERGAYDAGKTKADDEHKSSKSFPSGAAGGVAGVGSSHSSASSKPLDSSKSKDNNESGLIVEVIGVDDKKVAARLAKKASKELKAQGIDLSSGKLVINAETKEVYKIDADDKVHDAIDLNSPLVSSSSTFDNDEKAKERLSAAAQSNTQSKSSTGKNAAIGTGVGAATAGTAYAALHHSKKSDVPSSYESNPPTSKSQGEKSLDSSSGEKPTYTTSSEIKSHSRAPVTGDAATRDLDQDSQTVNTHAKSHAPEVVASALGAGAAMGAGVAAVNHSEKSKLEDNKGVKSSTAVEEKAKPLDSGSGPAESDIIVTVHGGNDKEASKIAEKVVKSLKTKPEILSTIKEIKINASTGVVTDEKGNVIAREDVSNLDSKVDVNSQTSGHHGLGNTAGAGILASGSTGVVVSGAEKLKTLEKDQNTASTHIGAPSGASANVTQPLDPEFDEGVGAYASHNQSQAYNQKVNSGLHSQPEVAKDGSNDVNDNHYRQSVGPNLTHDDSVDNKTQSRGFESQENAATSLSKAAEGSNKGSHPKEVNPKINSALAGKPEMKKGTTEEHFRHDIGSYESKDTDDGLSKSAIGAGLAGIGGLSAAGYAATHSKQPKNSGEITKTSTDTSLMNPTPANTTVDDTAPVDEFDSEAAINGGSKSKVIGYDASADKDLTKAERQPVSGYDANNNSSIGAPSAASLNSEDTKSTSSSKKKKSLFGFLSRSKSAKEREQLEASSKLPVEESEDLSKSSKSEKPTEKSSIPIPTAMKSSTSGGSISPIAGSSYSSNSTTQVDTSHAQGSNAPFSYGTKGDFTDSTIPPKDTQTSETQNTNWGVIGGGGAAAAAAAAGIAYGSGKEGHKTEVPQTKNDNVNNLESLEKTAKSKIEHQSEPSNELYGNSTNLGGNKSAPDSSKLDDAYYGYASKNAKDQDIAGIESNEHSSAHSSKFPQSSGSPNDVVIDIVGCPKDVQERLQAEKLKLVQEHPELIPSLTKRIVFDAKTGIAYDGTGKQISALSTLRSYSLDENFQSNKVEMPGSFFN